jgi:hypothetical protein
VHTVTAANNNNNSLPPRTATRNRISGTTAADKQLNNDILTSANRHKPKIKNFKIKQTGRHFSDGHHMTIEDEIAGLDLDNGIEAVHKYEVRNWKYHLTNNHF